MQKYIARYMMNANDRHLIAVDLDDTILNDLFSLNVKSVWKLIDLKDAGHVVMIATARPTCLAMPYYRALGLNSLLSTVNGNYLYHPDDPSIPMIRHELDAGRADAVISVMEDLELQSPWMQSDDVIYRTGEALNVPYFRIMFAHGQTHAVDQLPRIACGRILGLAKDEQTAMLAHDRITAAGGVTCTVYKNGFGTYSVSCTSEEADKWTTVHEAAKFYGIRDENIWCFGDENNDRKMVMNAAHGYAMVNGNPKLIADMQALGKGVTRLPCHEGGVADILAQLL